MNDNEKEEAANLKDEFEWVLREEVHAILHQLHSVLVECAHRFPVPLYGNEGQKQDKFILTSQPEQLKCIVTLTGDSITHADISFKVLRQMHTICRTSINQDGPWKLQQIQDAANHLQQAIGYIDNVDKHYVFRSSEEVLHIIQCLIGSLQRARTALVLPKKKAIDELMKSRNMKALSPNLPEDLAISFYIQSHKLIFVAYQLSFVHGSMRIDSCQADCAVPWLSDVLFMLTASLHMCQQLKDKLCVFSQYKDFTVGSRSASMELVDPDVSTMLVLVNFGGCNDVMVGDVLLTITPLQPPKMTSTSMVETSGSTSSSGPRQLSPENINITNSGRESLSSYTRLYCFPA